MPFDIVLFSLMCPSLTCRMSLAVSFLLTYLFLYSPFWAPSIYRKTWLHDRIIFSGFVFDISSYRLKHLCLSWNISQSACQIQETAFSFDLKTSFPNSVLRSNAKKGYWCYWIRSILVKSPSAIWQRVGTPCNWAFVRLGRTEHIFLKRITWTICPLSPTCWRSLLTCS